MKNAMGLTVMVLLIITGILHSCKKEELPALLTSAVTNITTESAYCGGNITSDGGAKVTAKGVCWSTDANPATSGSKTSDGAGTGQFASTLSGLSAGSTYHVRAYATNSVGTAYGADMSFTTLGKLPEAKTGSVTNLTSSGATLNGTVNANFLSTTVTFDYGTTINYGQTVTPAQNPVTGNGTTNITADISGLTPGTTYHYRIKTLNSLGTALGDDQSFSTLKAIPAVTTLQVSEKTSKTAVSGGNVTSDGGSPVTDRGICWSTIPDPEIQDSHISNGTGTGSFTCGMNCLSFATTYYVRAYAINSIGTAYGDQQVFTTPGDHPIIFNPGLTYGSVSDIDGNCYKTIQIGDEIWMAENLKTSRYNEGTSIPNVTDNTEWGNLLSSISTPPYVTTGAYCWYDNDSANYENVYGKLYNWGVVNTGKICPVGWHVPSWIDGLDNTIISEDCYLNSYLGGGLMETGSNHWINPNSACINNETGFTAVPSGKRNNDGTFTELGYRAYFWVPGITGHGPMVINQEVPHSASYCHSPTSCGIFPTEGHSIRCVKDN